MEKEDINWLEKGISFIRSPAKTGDRYVFTIPKSYIRNKLIDPEKKYKIFLAEIEENKNEKD